MSKDIAVEIAKQYGDIKFDHPIIKFGYNKIEIKETFDVYMIIFLAIVLCAIVTFFFMVNVPFPLYFIPALFIFLLSVFYVYNNHFDKITIDFLSKELTIENRMPFINSYRKLVKRPLLIPFSDIGYFMTDHKGRDFMLPGRLLGNMYVRKTSLYVTPKFKTPILLVTFQFERDARRLGELLQYHITGKATHFTGLSND